MASEIDKALSFVHDHDNLSKVAKIYSEEKGVYNKFVDIFPGINMSSDIYVSWSTVRGINDYIELTFYDFSEFKFSHMRMNIDFIG